MNQNQNDTTEPSLTLNVKRVRTHVRGGVGKTNDDGGLNKTAASNGKQYQGGAAVSGAGTFSAAGPIIPGLPPRV